MEESQNFGHEHPLQLLNEEQIISIGSKRCSRCREKVSGPSFSCVDYCRFYLHKKCAEAPLEIHHPFHPDHPLLLLQIPPYRARCDFCGESCKRFLYHCFCGLHFHIRCALFTYNIAEKNFKELEHVACEDPSDSENDDGEWCFGCWERLKKYNYFSLDCGFNLHQKCSDLPLKINHMGHRKHPLVLQFNGKQLSCKICGETQIQGLVYCCSTCEFVVHIKCLSPLPIIEDKRHQHPLTLFRSRSSFICDACGTEGYFFSYICCTCNIIVHEKCISLPRVIKSKWHDHLIFHKYFQEGDFECSDCRICHDEVNPEHGSYSCSSCSVMFHVNCVTRNKSSYFVVSLENEDENSSKSLQLFPESITCVIERNSAGEATKVKHCKHIHDLIMNVDDKIDHKCCDGCMLPVSASFYHCSQSQSQCDFFLHKACAEFPQMKYVWHHRCSEPLILTSDNLFRCENCYNVSNGFAYKCDECKSHTCLRCVIALTPAALTCQGHEHSLLYYNEKAVCPCKACGDSVYRALQCKRCGFVLHSKCFSIPITAQHYKCDEHLLALTYHDGNDYSKSHYCDICEEERNPARWYYHCETCETSAHINCVLGGYPFIKLGSIYKDEKEHPHPLTFVKKIYDYPYCNECYEHCQDLALECAESGCNYTVHWECIAPDHLQVYGWELMPFF